MHVNIALQRSEAVSEVKEKLLNRLAKVSTQVARFCQPD